MKEMKEKYINDQYDRIVKDIAGSRLFGEPVDILDHKTLVVCAYGLAEYEQREKHARDLDSLRSFDK